ncbi:MAG: hypothetical protein WCF67_04480 [Chitinophagaceae bacterium]
MNFKALLLLILPGLLLLSCKKNTSINEGTLLKRTVKVSSNQHTTVDTFMYDSQARLTGIKYFNTNTEYDKEIMYDAQGRLSKVRYIYLGVEQHSYSFIYNDKGQIIKKIATSAPGFDYPYGQSYAYDNVGRVIADTNYDQRTNTVRYYSTFKYDNNGNIIEDDFHNFVDPRNQGKMGFSFDNYPNPYNAQGSIYFYVTGNYAYLNKNNIVQITSWGTRSIETGFEYQSNGLPKNFTYDLNGANRATYLFEYR